MLGALNEMLEAPKDMLCVCEPPTSTAATSPAPCLQGIADKMKGINQVASVAFTPQGDMHMQVRDSQHVMLSPALQHELSVKDLLLWPDHLPLQQHLAG